MRQTRSTNNIGILENDSPFISQRTLRKYAHLQRKAPPPPPAQLQTKKVPKKKQKTGSNAPFGGMFNKLVGLVRGPPAMTGVSLYYFDPFSPPNFSQGTYGVTLTTTSSVAVPVETKGSTAAVAPATAPSSSKSQLAAPPLPPYVTGIAASVVVAAVVEAAPRKIIINRVKKDEKKEEPKATGWQAIMAEMTKRANGGLKAAPNPEEKKAPPPPKKEEKKPGGKKKKFKDVMEELAYKLAVKRGEIIESDDEAPAAAEAKPTTGKEDTPAKKDEETKAESKDALSPGPKKLPAKPDLAAMLSKILPKPAEAKVAEGGGPKKLAAKPDLAAMLSKVLPKPAAVTGSDAPAVPVSSSTASSGDSGIGTIAVPKPANIPAPPPVPETWPPKPYMAATTTLAVSISTPSAAATTTTTAAAVPSSAATTMQTVTNTTKSTQPLPEGYYIASPKAGLVEPFGIFPAGMITESILTDLTNQFMEEEEPLPEPDIHPPIVPVDMSRYSKLNEPLNIPNKLSVNDLPVPPGYVATVDRMKKVIHLRNQTNEFKQRMELRNYDGELTAPNAPVKPYVMPCKPCPTQEVKFFTEKHFENKARTFRKPKTRSEEDRLPITGRIDNHVTQRNHAYGENLCVPDSYFAGILRKFKEEPGNMNAPPTATTNAIPASSDTSMLHHHQRGTHSKSEDHHTAMMTASQSQGTLPSTPYTPTEPKAPRFRSQEAADRRQYEKEMKAYCEQQNEMLQQEQMKKYKEYLHTKALETAKMTGAYKPAGSNRTVHKMVAKYSNRCDIGVDLAHMTYAAREQYYLTTNASCYTELTHSTHNAWEYLENETVNTPVYTSRSPHYPKFGHAYHYHHAPPPVNQMEIDELVLEDYN